MVKTIMLIPWMVSPCIHSSVYEFESGLISPDPSLSFLQIKCWGFNVVIVSIADCPFKVDIEFLLQATLSALCSLRHMTYQVRVNSLKR